MVNHLPKVFHEQNECKCDKNSVQHILTLEWLLSVSALFYSQVVFLAENFFIAIKFAESRFENYEVLLSLLLEIYPFFILLWPSPPVIQPKSCSMLSSGFC